MNSGGVRAIQVMGTIATIQVVGDQSDPSHLGEAEAAVERAFRWFHRIEECCSRFRSDSELSRLTSHVGQPVAVSDILLEAVHFAVAAAEESGGAFDPTVGLDMERRGFNREHLTGRVVQRIVAAPEDVSYRDVLIDRDRRTITLVRPLVLDLGAVAKGLAVDMAARELGSFTGFAVDAGGDMFLGGCRPDGTPWSVGIRHPRLDGELIDVVRVSNRAVCTSGDYERRGTSGEGHIIDGRARGVLTTLASATVIAPTAMLADVLATAAFVMGPQDGVDLLERHGVDGMLVTPSLERHQTRGFRSERAILQDSERPADHHPGRPAGDRGSDRGHRPDIASSC